MDWDCLEEVRKEMYGSTSRGVAFAGRIGPAGGENDTRVLKW